MDEPIIRVDGVGCQSGNRFLLKNIQLEIPENSRWIILGMNGCGKTTLLSTLAGYQDYTHGDIYYRGTNYRNLDMLELRRKMGFISNSYFDRVYTQESVMDLILAGVSGTFGMEEMPGIPQRIRKIKRLLAHVGLEDRLDYSYNWLSKGERQSVLIVRALLAQPEVLVLDEPMTGLDVVAKEKMKHFVRSAAQQKQTMLYVTHHFEEISPELFDNCILMRQGQIFQMGKVEEMIRNDVISAFLQQQVSIEQTGDGYYHLQHKHAR